jgi:DNA-binding response OmpR family regulator
MRETSILLVEDETLIRMMLVQMVEELGYRVVAEAASVDDGRSRAEMEEYDLAILDINLQGFNTSELLKDTIESILSNEEPKAQDNSGPLQT